MIRITEESSSKLHAREISLAAFLFWAKILNAVANFCHACAHLVLGVKAAILWFRLEHDGMFTIIEPDEGKVSIARSILEGLPEWFGILQARERYIERAAQLPMTAVSVGTEIIGFLSVENKTRVSSEIHVLGIRRDWHRRGVGKILLRATEDALIRGKIRYLIAKTLS